MTSTHPCATSPANTSLKRHIAFFDINSDGKISPLETFTGMRQLNAGLAFSAFTAAGIHLTLSWFTQPTILPDPLFRINVEGAERMIHGSDTGIYDKAGKFSLERFNGILNMFTAPPHTHIKFWEIVKMLNADRNPFDLFGVLGAMAEWFTVCTLLPKDGVEGIKREDIKGIYDGTIFYRIAGRKIPEELQDEREGNSYADVVKRGKVD
ncbi:Caleosin [Flagelloscypha sp. PMI_526]|nr:Caleosin [Flagelloscypha sp. PMI_526]